MFELNNFLLFLGAAILLNLAPGPDLFYIISRSIAQGRKAGMFSSFGVCTGALVHAIAAALGLSAILATSAVAFTIVKWIGAIYLVCIGLQAIFCKNGGLSMPDQEMKKQRVSTIFIQGVLTDVLNPKVAIFFLAFLPQFVDPQRGYPAVQFIVLGLTIIFIGLVWEFLVVSFTARISNTLRRNRWITLWLHKTMGVIFVGLGLRLATEKS